MEPFTPYLGNKQLTISLPMVAAVNKQQFQRQPNLQLGNEDIQIKSIITYSTNVVTRDPNNFLLPTTALLQNSFLVLKIKEQEVVKFKALQSYAPEYNGYKYLEQDLINVEWEKSYIWCNATAVALLNTAWVWYLEISYNRGPVGLFGNTVL